MKRITVKFNRACLVSLAVALALFMVSPAGAEEINVDKIIDAGLLDKATRNEKVDVIVLLAGYKDYVGTIRADAPIKMAASQGEIQLQQGIVLSRLAPSQFELKLRFENILGFAGKASAEGLFSLAAMPEVEIIEEDEIEHLQTEQGIPLMNAAVPRQTYDGTGLSIGISDTGIDYTHTRLGGGGFPNDKVIGGYDFGDNDTDPMDCQGHGTAVAGVSAGDLPVFNDYIGGVAHNARLYALKIVPACEGSASSSNIAGSWDWAVTHKNDNPSYPLLVINTSFGGANYSDPCDASEPTYAAAANNLVANGITLFCSSGNDADSNGISRPGCVTNATSVGAVYDANVGGHFYSNCGDSTTAADQITCYSNSDTFLDILAPSHDAYTSAVGGGWNTSFGGTSAASPYAAGAAGIIQHWAKTTTGSFLTPEALRDQMANTGDPITDLRNNVTKPRVNVSNALTPIWPLCFQDSRYSDVRYGMMLEWDRVIRGLASVSTPDPAFPAPITGQFDPLAQEATFSVDYLDQGGLRFYRINVTNMQGMSWAIVDNDAGYSEFPTSVFLLPCGTTPPGSPGQ